MCCFEKERTYVVTESFLYRVKQYIEEIEVCLEQEMYECRSLEELKELRLMPLIYDETLKILNNKGGDKDEEES